MMVAIPSGFYVVIRGPLGSGKTTLARGLADRLHGHYVSIDRILEENGLEQWESGYIAEASFLRANEVAMGQASAHFANGTPVVFDGNFYWKSAVDDLVNQLRFPHVVFTLKVPLGTCVARDANRAEPLGPANVRAVFEKVEAVPCGLPIDSTGSVEETLRLLLKALREARMPGV